ncbi:hypothetical protein VIBC2010_04299 [Vibrio caribbeanicus ATCC BAA-2122]|uniref:Uncharacterized protein n=1 Tax=Vibrio caribbeanicus ATCC BAA-2122 TaxID=796620 RepID=E3BN81_9VIBR|nr:hypothetical protein VIBC2010_04299 [Vibrio caribbeanicus ATCC BAA-2122]
MVFIFFIIVIVSVDFFKRQRIALSRYFYNFMSYFGWWECALISIFQVYNKKKRGF